MCSAFRGISLVAEQQSRGAIRDHGLHLSAALRLSAMGKSPGLRPFSDPQRSRSFQVSLHHLARLAINAARHTPRVDTEECALFDAANCRAMFYHSEWYRDLIAKHRGPANQSPIVMWPYPIEPRPPIWRAFWIKLAQRLRSTAKPMSIAQYTWQQPRTTSPAVSADVMARSHFTVPGRYELPARHRSTARLSPNTVPLIFANAVIAPRASAR